MNTINKSEILFIDNCILLKINNHKKQIYSIDHGLVLTKNNLESFFDTKLSNQIMTSVSDDYCAWYDSAFSAIQKIENSDIQNSISSILSFQIDKFIKRHFEKKSIYLKLINNGFGISIIRSSDFAKSCNNVNLSNLTLPSNSTITNKFSYIFRIKSIAIYCIKIIYLYFLGFISKFSNKKLPSSFSLTSDSASTGLYKKTLDEFNDLPYETISSEKLINGPSLFGSFLFSIKSYFVFKEIVTNYIFEDYGFFEKLELFYLLSKFHLIKSSIKYLTIEKVSFYYLDVNVAALMSSNSVKDLIYIPHGVDRVMHTGFNWHADQIIYMAAVNGVVGYQRIYKNNFNLKSWHDKYSSTFYKDIKLNQNLSGVTNIYFILPITLSRDIISMYDMLHNNLDCNFYHMFILTLRLIIVMFILLCLNLQIWFIILI